MIQYGFFADHFPDKVAAVLSDLAAGSTEASQSITSMGTSTADSTRTLVDRLVNRQTSQSSRRVLGDLENV